MLGDSTPPGSREDAYRSFCDVLDGQEEAVSGLAVQEECDAAFEAVACVVRDNVIGQNVRFKTPFGDKPMVYADWTATGKPLAMIEQYITQEVMPMYGNTHTTTSITGHQSTCFRHEARQIIAQATNAKITGRASEDVVLFCGSGCTAAISKVVSALGLHTQLPTGTAEQDRPVVFVGPFEHHSNLLPWRESCAEVVVVADSSLGGMDLQDLEQKLKRFASRRLKIGSFSAASNVTGILCDVNATTALLHRHGAFAFWDYATAAPYVKVDMNPLLVGEDQPFVYKDAVFLSGHKFLGGPGTPGVLVVKKKVLANAVPTHPGGGTVFYVTDNDHRYLSNKEEREEGGTPDILGSIRLGLAVQLKERLGSANIHRREAQLARHAMEQLTAHPSIVLLGGQAAERLPIFSFLIRCNGAPPQSSRFLHYNFVCALLNDLFGVQSRGGCQCAGPYGQNLLGIDEGTVRQFEAALLDKQELLRPGFTRISLTYFNSPQEVKYILDAVLFVASHGWRFLPEYRLNHKTGEWKHVTRFTRFAERKWLGHFDYGLPATSQQPTVPPPSLPAVDAVDDALLYEHMMEDARAALQALAQPQGAARQVYRPDGLLGKESERLRWFVYPWESTAVADPASVGQPATITGPSSIRPRQYLADTPAVVEPMEVAPALLVSSDSEGEQGLKAEEGGAAVRKPPSPSTPAPLAKKSKLDDSYKYPLRAAPDSVPVFLQAGSLTGMSKANEASQKAQLFPKPHRKLMRTVGQAIQEWCMIEEGDRLCLGLSGGKDSLTLLHVLLALQKKAPIRFEIACATVDPQTPSFDPSPMIPYMEKLGVKYHFLSEGIIERARTSLQGDSLCAFCSRMKRGLLYKCCRDNGYNKLVLAQHLDDLAESFIMSALHNGQVRTMKANYKIEAGDVSVIRPLIYTREATTKEFARENRLPVINENCPACFEEPKERHRVKKMLAKEESLFPNMYGNIRRALLPLMEDGVYDVMKVTADRVLARSMGKRKSQKGRQQPGSASADLNSSSAAAQASHDPLPAPRIVLSDQSQAAVRSVLTAAGVGSAELEAFFSGIATVESPPPDQDCSGDVCVPCFEIA